MWKEFFLSRSKHHWLLGLIGLGAVMVAIALRYFVLAPGVSSQGISSQGVQSKFSPDLSSDQITPQTLEQNWIVSAEQAVTLVQQGAMVLDVRSHKRLKPSIPMAIPVTWQEFSRSETPWRGNLLDEDHVLNAKFQKLGIVTNRPVIVIGDGKNGWGEEGRMVWMLRTLGHSQAVWVDGGGQGLWQAKLGHVQQVQDPPENTSNVPAQSSPVKPFTVQRRPDWEIQREVLRQQLGRPNLVILDTREPREYSGQTPYGESRGGHLPGAIPLYFKDWLDETGLLLPREVILQQLAQQGITRDMEIITYCTGGVRSAWVTSVLVSLGFNAKNYGGSMWEWSAFPALTHPLVLGQETPYRLQETP
ncbi:MAG: sulfurtransferase [Microcoleaceae cyanobacterium]